MAMFLKLQLIIVLDTFHDISNAIKISCQYFIAIKLNIISKTMNSEILLLAWPKHPVTNILKHLQY